MYNIELTKTDIKCALSQEKSDLVIKDISVLNVFTEQFEICDVAVKNGMIVGLGEYSGVQELDGSGKTLVPGFIDGHMHIESSVLSPRQFCKAVVPHGTTAIIADPHEITNVCGLDGFNYISEASKGLPMDIYLMVPSCVPATPFDESGAVISSKDVEEMLKIPNVLGLAEMMNYPGVLMGDNEVLSKVKVAVEQGKIIDGHAPTVSGNELNAYIGVGVSSEHECTGEAEALEKIARGQWIMVREGTACKNLSCLISLFNKPYCDRCMLATDDKHPGELICEGHIDYIIKKAIASGASPINAYKMASYNAALHFGLQRNGAIAPGYYADFVVLDDVNTVKINSVYKRGIRVDSNIDDIINSLSANSYNEKVLNTVNISNITPESFLLKKPKEKVIGLVSGQILTTDEGYAYAVDTKNDICKLAVVERHRNTGNIGVTFVKGYGLKSGAVATTVAHDSHNIIAAGTNDKDMAFAVNRLKEIGGGMVVVNNEILLGELPLPIAGLMCDADAKECQEMLSLVKTAAYSLGVNKNIDPFMTLSFSSLAVVPTLRLTTKGVVDVTCFELLD